MNTTGSYNTAHGQAALFNNTTASNNTAVGYQAGYSNTTGSETVAVGNQALRSQTTGRNTAVGFNAGLDVSTGTYNTLIGGEAGENITTGSYNTIVGLQAGRFVTTEANNTFIGQAAGYNTTGGRNTFVGIGAGSAVTTGAKNSIIGNFNGNGNGLDIRTSSNNIVLSDGDGQPHARSFVSDSQRNFIIDRSLLFGNGAVNGGNAAQIVISDNSNFRSADFDCNTVSTQYDTGHIFVTASGADGGAGDQYTAWYLIRFAVYNNNVSYISTIDSGGATSNVTVAVSDQGDSGTTSGSIWLRVAVTTQSGNNTMIANVTVNSYRGIYAVKRT